MPPSAAEPNRRRASPRRRTLTVARREFLATVTRRGYLLTLVLMPALLGALATLPTIGVALSGGEEKLLGIKSAHELTTVGVVDLATPPVIDEARVRWHNDDQAAAIAEGRTIPEWMRKPEGDLPPLIADVAAQARRDWGGFDPKRRVRLVTFEDRDSAAEAARDGEVDEVFVLQPDYRRTSLMRVLLPTARPLNPGAYAGQTAVARLVRASLAGPHIDDEQTLQRILQVMETREEVLVEEGEAAPPGTLEQALGTLVPLLFAMFFSMMIFVASGYLLDGIGEEKENRVLEILLASVTAEELLLGKMIGLGAAGLLQSAFFAGIAIGPLLLLGTTGLAATDIAAMFGCALLGYALYASLMGATGAVAGNRHEGRQISALWTMTAILPVFLMPAFLAGGDAPAAVVLSLLPPTAPVGMTLRLGVGDVPGWQLAASYTGMLVSAWLAWRLGSRVFRVGVLMTGARPSVKQIWGWLRRG